MAVGVIEAGVVEKDVGLRGAPVLRGYSASEKVSDLQYHPHKKPNHKFRSVCHVLVQGAQRTQHGKTFATQTVSH